MTPNDGPGWGGRILGGIVIAALTFGSLCFWDTWDLSLAWRAGIAGGVGLIFALVSGSILSWSNFIDWWS